MARHQTSPPPGRGARTRVLGRAWTDPLSASRSLARLPGPAGPPAPAEQVTDSASRTRCCGGAADQDLAFGGFVVWRASCSQARRLDTSVARLSPTPGPRPRFRRAVPARRLPVLHRGWPTGRGREPGREHRRATSAGKQGCKGGPHPGRGFRPGRMVDGLTYLGSARTHTLSVGRVRRSTSGC